MYLRCISRNKNVRNFNRFLSILIFVHLLLHRKIFPICRSFPQFFILLTTIVSSSQKFQWAGFFNPRRYIFLTMTWRKSVKCFVGIVGIGDSVFSTFKTTLKVFSPRGNSAFFGENEKFSLLETLQTCIVIHFGSVVIMISTFSQIAENRVSGRQISKFYFKVYLRNHSMRFISDPTASADLRRFTDTDKCNIFES